MNNCEFIELIANIATILGFIIGIGYVYKIYNKIEISIQGKYITNVGKLDISIPDKENISKIALQILKDMKYKNKNI